MPNPFVEEISGLLADATGLPKGDLEGLIEVPPDPEMGDYAMPCFVLAKRLRKAPNQIASELVQKIPEAGRVTEVRATGPYVNFFVSKGVLAEETLKEALAKGTDYGKSEAGHGKTVVIDFSHPNIAKPFGIHHLRSTVIGNALRNVYRARGYEVVGVNHLGDWGSQFAKLILAWTRWGEGELTEEITIQELLELYVRIHDEIEDNPEAEKEAAGWFRRLEAGDPEARRMWEVCCSVSYKEFDRVYNRLGIEFETVAGESFYLDKLQGTLDRLDEKGLLKKSEGATIVDLSEWDMSPMILRRSDEATLYHTRDMAAAEYRWATYGFEKLLYVVDVAQTLHFRQLVKGLELMEHEWVDRCEHVVFGRLRFKDGGMSTRRGKVIFLEDVLDRAEALAQQIIDEKNPDLPGKADVVRDVGIGAVIFADLDSRRAKDVVFDWDEILNFSGETGPYVQYTHARYCSVLRKYGKPVPPADCDLTLLSEPEAVAVVKCLGQFPERIENAADLNEPSLIATYLIDLCNEANRFYNAHRVVSDDGDLTKVRIALVYAISVVLANGLALLGIKAPEEM